MIRDEKKLQVAVARQTTFCISNVRIGKHCFKFKLTFIGRSAYIINHNVLYLYYQNPYYAHV